MKAAYKIVKLYKMEVEKKINVSTAASSLLALSAGEQVSIIVFFSSNLAHSLKYRERIDCNFFMYYLC